MIFKPVIIPEDLVFKFDPSLCSASSFIAVWFRGIVLIYCHWVLFEKRVCESLASFFPPLGKIWADRANETKMRREREKDSQLTLCNCCKLTAGHFIPICPEPPLQALLQTLTIR